jgi:hypothetical protein
MQLLAALSLLYLGALVVTGAMPQQRQLARFEAKGLMREAPEQIARIELRRGTDRLVLRRVDATGWETQDGARIGEAAARIDTGLKMLRNSGPVRELSPAELIGTDRAAFGLEPAVLTMTLYATGSAPVFAAQFGSRNPEDYLQYMRLEGDERLFLMSRFIGVEWDEAMTAILGR